MSSCLARCTSSVCKRQITFPDGTDTLHLDQQLALARVKHNVEAFGGDTGNVTIFGESADGSDVKTMIATPRMKDYFHKAIIQSMVPFTNPDEDTVIAWGDGSQVPLMVGTNLEEDRYWTAMCVSPDDKDKALSGLWATQYSRGDSTRRGSSTTPTASTRSTRSPARIGAMFRSTSSTSTSSTAPLCPPSSTC